MSIVSICHALDSRFCAFLDARKAASEARKAAEAAKAAADMKILDEVVCFETSGLTYDQARHAVAHARNISERDVRDAIKRVQKACKREMEQRILENDLEEFFSSFTVTLILFFGCLFFMWYVSAK